MKIKHVEYTTDSLPVVCVDNTSMMASIIASITPEDYTDTIVICKTTVSIGSIVDIGKDETVSDIRDKMCLSDVSNVIELLNNDIDISNSIKETVEELVDRGRYHVKNHVTNLPRDVALSLELDKIANSIGDAVRCYAHPTNEKLACVTHEVTIFYVLSRLTYSENIKKIGELDNLDLHDCIVY